MLERKKVLRQIERQREEGGSVLVYEHLPSGEVWLIEDPGLKLGELSAVQDEVAHLLARRVETAATEHCTAASVSCPDSCSSSAVVGRKRRSLGTGIGR